jgi:hypothetical protein
MRGARAPPAVGNFIDAHNTILVGMIGKGCIPTIHGVFGRHAGDRLTPMHKAFSIPVSAETVSRVDACQVNAVRYVLTFRAFLTGAAREWPRKIWHRMTRDPGPLPGLAHLFERVWRRYGRDLIGHRVS